MNYFRYRARMVVKFTQSALVVPLYRIIIAVWLGVVCGVSISQHLFLTLLSIVIILCFIKSWQRYLPLVLIVFVSYSRANYVATELMHPQVSNIETTAIAIEDGVLGDFNQQVMVSLAERPGSLTLITAPKYPQILAGNNLRVKGSLQLPANGSDFDYVGYLRSQGVATVMPKGEVVVFAEGSDLGSLLRAEITRLIRLYSLEPQSSLLMGLVIGKGGSFDDDLRLAMQNAGVTHLVSVSGYNIGLIVVAIMTLAGILHRRLLIIVAMILIVVFLLVVGLGNMPALRAGVMGELTLFGLLLGRPGSIWRALVITLTIFLLNNPFSITDLSLLLSAGALMGILVLMPRLQKVLPSLPGQEVIAGTLAATAATYPLTASSFGGFSVIGLLSNLLLVPAIGAITLAGYVCIGLSAVSKFLGEIVFLYLNTALELVVQVIVWCANLPFAYTTDIRLLRLVACALVALIIYADYKYVQKHLQAPRSASAGNNLHPNWH